MNIFSRLFKRNKIDLDKQDCDIEQVCPLYLKHVNDLSNENKHIKYCKYTKKPYCHKYKLIDEEEYEKMSSEEQIDTIIKSGVVEYNFKFKDKFKDKFF